jgi:hypothetical protein
MGWFDTHDLTCKFYCNRGCQDKSHKREAPKLSDEDVSKFYEQLKLFGAKMLRDFKEQEEKDRQFEAMRQELDKIKLSTTEKE